MSRYGLITQRSQVQILSPRRDLPAQTKGAGASGPFAFPQELADGVELLLETLIEVPDSRDDAVHERGKARAISLPLRLEARRAPSYAPPKLEAQRKAGQTLSKMAQNGERLKGRPKRVHGAVNLSELGVTPNQSSLWQRQVSRSNSHRPRSPVQSLDRIAELGYDLALAGFKNGYDQADT